MQISRTYLLFVLFSFLAVAYKYLIYTSYPEIAQLTDFFNYDAIFRGDAEDVGFYPVFIAIKNIFVYFGIPYPVFQIIVSSLYTISICTFIVLSLKSLKVIPKSIVMVSVVIAIVYSLFSYSSLKSFSLVKFFLSISILGFSCCTIRPTIFRLVSPSLLNLTASLLASPQTFPALLLYSNNRLRQPLLSFRNTVTKLKITKFSITTENLFRFIALVLIFFIIWFLVSLSPIITDGSVKILSALLIAFAEKVSAYLPSEFLNLSLSFFAVCVILLPIVCFMTKSSHLFLTSIALILILLFGTNRFSPLIPFFLFSLLSNRPVICICLLDLFLLYDSVKGFELLI